MEDIFKIQEDEVLKHIVYVRNIKEQEEILTNEIGIVLFRELQTGLFCSNLLHADNTWKNWLNMKIMFEIIRELPGP